jgi:hypothetical protein
MELKKIDGQVGPGAGLGVGLGRYERDCSPGIQPGSLEGKRGTRGPSTPVVKDDNRTASRCVWRDHDDGPGTPLEQGGEHSLQPVSCADVKLNLPTHHHDIAALRFHGM